jgi:DNA-binding TFAR19-related protein (PDSD5 family)
MPTYNRRKPGEKEQNPLGRDRGLSMKESGQEPMHAEIKTDLKEMVTPESGERKTEAVAKHPEVANEVEMIGELEVRSGD